MICNKVLTTEKNTTFLTLREGCTLHRHLEALNCNYFESSNFYQDTASEPFFYFRAGTDHNGKSETESKQNGHPENGENGTVGEERKRKHDDTSVIGDQSDEDVKKESNGTTDVNGNEGPDAKKRKLGHIENGHKNEVVRYYDVITFRSYTTKQAV